MDVNKPPRGVVVVDFSRAPDDPGRRADINYALRILVENGMLEVLVFREQEES